LSEIRTFFRYCPSCGRRFEIRVVGKRFVDEKEVQKTEMMNELRPQLVLGYPGSTELDADHPVTVDIEEFRYTYKCKHCGHMWSEVHDIEGKSRADR
jgi:uncharacterized Zn finger protein